MKLLVAYTTLIDFLFLLFLVLLAQIIRMRVSTTSNTTRWGIVFFSFLIVLLILWNTYTFFQIFKEEERNKMELWVKALKTLNNADLDDNVELPSEIIKNNSNLPIIITNKNGKIINSANIEPSVSEDNLLLHQYLLTLKTQNKPLEMQISKDNYQLVYFGNSSLITKLKYYPIALLLILILFSTVVYNFYNATKMATQNKLWAGMAKETAHQIGTPLSSLIGWLEILKNENIDPEIVVEIEKDINRLQTITDRFSKIGSKPIVEIKDIIAETQQTFAYLKNRSSKQIDFQFLTNSKDCFVLINPALHSWTIENLIKNAIDAMKGKGKLIVAIDTTTELVKIRISDTGKGIPKSSFRKVFEPGYTTKKRGWGLGLSLTKRIVEEYHNGKIKVVQSEIGKGTTFQISYKLATKTII